LSDFTISAGVGIKGKFKVHKVVLAIRSTVFSAMFKTKGMKESKNNEMTIEDFGVDAVQEFLEYL
jgi:hypothetical protein